jgi:hypothetical protein
VKIGQSASDALNVLKKLLIMMNIYPEHKFIVGILDFKQFHKTDTEARRRMILVARAPEMVNCVCHLISEDSLIFQMLASKYNVVKDTTRATGADSLVTIKICSCFVPLTLMGTGRKENGCVLKSSGNN